MSARDAESGSSSYKGGSGRAGGLGNGGIGGGMGGGGNHGGGMGGGAGRNGGGGSQTGLSTGKTMYGNTAWGRPGGYTQGYATRLSNGRLTDFRRPDGTRPRPIKSAISQAAPEAVGAPPPAVQPPITGPWPGQAVPPPPAEVYTPWNPFEPEGPTVYYGWHDKLRAYQSAYGPEGYAFAGQGGVKRTVDAINNYNSRNGYGGGVTDTFNRTYR